MKFRKCDELLKGKRFSLKIKGKVVRAVRSTTLYGSVKFRYSFIRIRTA